MEQQNTPEDIVAALIDPPEQTTPPREIKSLFGVCLSEEEESMTPAEVYAHKAALLDSLKIQIMYDMCAVSTLEGFISRADGAADPDADARARVEKFIDRLKRGYTI